MWELREEILADWETNRSRTRLPWAGYSVAAFCIGDPMDEFDLFLTEEEKIALTGCKTNKGQIEALRKMHVAFFLSASQVPIVSRLAAEGHAREKGAEVGGKRRRGAN